MIRRTVDIALALGAIAISGFVLFWPTTPGPPLFPYADKVIHAAVFALLAITCARAGAPTRALAVTLVVYAVGSEVVQHTVLPGRSGDWTDVVADLAGIALGLTPALLRDRAGRRAG